MLSPVKLYQHDKKKQRTPRTWGPNGKPKAGCSGTACYKHEKVDWTVHRLTPAVYERSKPGGVKQKAISKAAEHTAHKDNYYARYHLSEHTKEALVDTSPRWGEGHVPSRHARKPVALPARGTVEMSKKGKVGLAVGGAAVASETVKWHQHNYKRTNSK